MSEQDQPISFFTTNLLNWHITTNKREMPWKNEKDPYRIWLSEVILQQTRVEQGRSYYNNFIRAFPTIHDLAQATDDRVFKLWEGLGYYSRCRNLLATARWIVLHCDGQFPSDYDAILQLKGVGPYTAAAIASFAFGLPHAVVDGNVYRVLARFFGIHTATDSTEGRKRFVQLAAECLDRERPAEYNQAIMDFGATVCMPANPACHNCPLKIQCKALATGSVNVLPVKSKLLKTKTRWFTYFIILKENCTLVRKRSGKDIWHNLHEFFLVEQAGQADWTNGRIYQQLEMLQPSPGPGAEKPFELLGTSAIFMQKLTHQHIHAQFIRVSVNSAFLAPAGYEFLPEEILKQLAFPKTITSYLEHYQKDGLQIALL